MKKIMLITVILVLFLLPIVTSTNTAKASTFFVQKAFWGISSTPVEAGPGDQNVPLTVIVQYYGILPFPSPASSVQATLNLPSGFTDVNGGRNTIAYASNVALNSVFQLGFNLNIDNNISTGLYSFPMNIMWNTTSPIVTNYSESISFAIQLKGKAKLSFDTSRVYLNPGQVNNILVILSNTGSGNATNISTFVTLPPQVSVLNQFTTIPKLEAYSSTLLNLSVFVSSSAANTPMTFSFTANYIDSYSNAKSASQNIGFIVKSYDEAFLKLYSYADSLAIGDISSVRFTLKNDGTTVLKDIILNVNAQPPINIINTDGKIDLGTLSPGQSTDFSLSVYVSSSATSSASIPFIFSYTDSSGIIRSDSRVLTFLLNTTSHVSPFTLKIQPTTLVAGRANNMTITITNTGTTPVKSISMTFMFASTQIIWLEPDIFQIDELLPGENVKIQAKVYDSPSASASTQLQVSIKYYDANNILNQEARNIGLLSQGLIDIKLVDSTILPETPRPGQIFSITVTMTNIGTITASAITATPDVPQGFKIFGSKSFFLGDVQTNSPTTFTISLQVDSNTKPGNYSIPVRITYFDNLRNPLSVTMNLEFNISDKSTTTTTQPNIAGGSNLFGLVVPIIIAIVMLAIGFILGKRGTRK